MVEKELVISLFAVEIEGGCAYYISSVEWNHETNDVEKEYENMTTNDVYLMEGAINYLSKRYNTRKVILTGFYEKGNLKYLPKRIRKRYEVYNFINSTNKTVRVK